MSILTAETCACTTECVEIVEPMQNCVNFLARSCPIATQFCDSCDATTWHQNGECLKHTRLH